MPRHLTVQHPTYQDLSANAEFSASSWAARLAGGLARRLERRLRIWRGQPDFPAEQTLASLQCCHWKQPAMLPTTAEIAAAVGFNQLDAADHLVQDFLAAVEPGFGGALPDGAGNRSLLQTGEALRGWWTWIADKAATNTVANRKASGANNGLRQQVTRALVQAAAWLARQVSASGELPISSAPGSIDRWRPQSLHLCWAVTLREVASHFDERSWREAAERLLTRLRRQVDFRRWQAPLFQVAPAWLALMELGETSLAAECLRRPASLQQKHGAVPAIPGARWTCLTGLAQLAQIWFALGETDRAAAAVAWCGRQQRADGSFPGSAGPEACFYANQAYVPAAANYLLASHAQVTAAFARHGDDFPSEIDDVDGRWLAVLNWARRLPPGARVADVGCGRGRYLGRLQQALPHLRLTGIDLCPAHLQSLPPGIEGRVGHLLRLPAESGEFDAAFCVEAMEHALVPQVALEELARVVQPGGTMLVIDKNRDHQALSEHSPWERWLGADETCDWLRVACNQVSVTPIAHGSHVQPTGLFLAWTARKRNAVVKAA